MTGTDDPCDDWSKRSLDRKTIRELDEEEKQRAKERDKRNGKGSTDQG